MSENSQKPQSNIGAVIHRRHKWDTPKHPISATCVKCGCKRFAEKFSTGMGWVYIKKGEVILPNAEVRFLKGRVAFKGFNTKGVYSTKNKGKHDSMICIFRGTM
ncbi:MAG: hypothetical protein KDE33_26715 [Bacteroidetes bacterium]|nr:hypothetical protein [Bacteroidota bacterium]